MRDSSPSSPSAALPVTRDLMPAYALSFLVALLMTVASVAGLLNKSSLYPTQELLKMFVANDVVNLFIGLPIMLGSMWLAWRGKLIGLLFWPGALFYVLYNYIVYMVGMLFSPVSLLYLALVALSMYTMLSLVAGIDGKAVRQRLAGVVPERFAGGVLMGLGALFFLRTCGLMVNALISHMPLARTELALYVADSIITPLWVVGGILLWRRRAFGYVAGAGLLFQASILFVGLLVFFVLQPFLTAASFPAADFVVVFIMGLACFIPFALFARGVISKGR